jgi:hypothetical protein
MKAFAVVITGLLLASPALAQPTPGTAEAGATAGLPDQGGAAAENATAPAADAASDENRPICRRVIADPSSRMGNRRVCMTAAQWRQSQRSN